uniref:Endonuclease I n=1 Tax=Rheinheimera sp. BAL341 TaxID=1708203 RepID=A0A486XI35_9GAMM
MLLRFFIYVALAFSVSLQAAPATFDRAKIEARQFIYHDRNNQGDFYCGCNWEWTGRSGGRVDLQSCGYQVRAQQTRAERTEWEHVVPASNFGRARQCWQNGGRKNCNDTDPVFNSMEADLHNLTPAIGEVNADRSNFNFTMLPQAKPQHGQCPVKVDFSARAVEPRDAIKGQIARIYFYMHDRYNLNMSRQQQQLLMAWDKQFPATEWERERDKRIAKHMGHHNPFVTGERIWSLGHKNRAEGVGTQLPAKQTQPNPGEQSAFAIKANKNSKVYHFPTGCPGYQQISPVNTIEFKTEQEAIAAGFRKAGNCR